MANIKITELNGITKKASDDVLAIVDVSANETKKIAVEDLLDKNVELIAVSDTEPAECSYGDKYYNTEDNLIYTAIANDTWGEDGEEPIEGIFYVVFGEQSSYAYNGTTLISVGGGTEDIIISPDQPTGNDWKLWIDSDEVGSQASEITNEYSTSTGLGYSANYLNDKIIAESGSNTNGYYIKYADGTLICTKSITGTLGGNAWGNIYYSDHSIGDWAYTFTSIYAATASVEQNQYWCNLCGYSFDSVRVFRPNSSTSSGTIRIMAIGRWKA